MDQPTIAERQRRHLAFWNRDPVDRPMVLIHQPSAAANDEDQRLEALRESDLQRFGSDPEILVSRARRAMQRQRSRGDALPLLLAPLGPSMLSAFLGARVEVARNTTWFHPTGKDLADFAQVEFDPSNPWWRITEECALRIAREPEGIPVVHDLGSLGDNLAALIGADQLMLDMQERPELVKQVLRRMLEIAKRCYGRLFAIAQGAGRGTASWLQVWSPQRTGILQNDLSIMLSTPMYRDFFADEFAEIGALIDHRLFHVDGTRAQRHVAPFISTLPGLHGCQLGSDPGTPAMKILPVIRQLQAAGKCVFTWVFPDEIEALFAEIRPEGMCMVTSAKSDAEAEDILRRLNVVCGYAGAK